MFKSLIPLTIVLLALAACGTLPPARIPYQPTASQGGGAAFLNNKLGVGY